MPMMVVAELIGLPDADIAQLVQWGYGATQLLEGSSTKTSSPTQASL
ncbi:putative cytochrome P450 144 domain protein [Mycobacterium ulcerans str. Harvey]|uniref:Cytochrome P450 144 domain protein n=1 Tax=Mycobacterium ulcerans str. Harvey TaxID=1299332 RepID=A0ABN0QUQ3_MYCUL|nr:putative cytochrome P450 144 domain protein [Mycobacterium ulcerans str. Harvey]